MNYKLDDDGKLYQKYLNKKINAKKEGILCLLSYEEFCALVENAGLKSSDLGFSGHGYVLARYGDSGNYTFDNCRFITQKDNIKERKLSDESVKASKQNIKIANAIRIERLKNKKTNSYNNIVKRNNSGIKICCTDDNLVFSSILKAGKYYGISDSSLKAAIELRDGYCKKVNKHFKYL